MNPPIQSALISVFYKDGLDEIVKALHQKNVTLYSTGGTRKFIEDLGIPCVAVEDITGYPSILGGRVKTLHPKVFGGILARRELAQDMEEIAQYEIPLYDLVMVDLYPFAETVAAGGTEEDIIEKIDIGGVSLIRAGAKNHAHTTIIAHKNEYSSFLKAFNEGNGSLSLAQRKSFAGRAFAVTAEYDGMIADWFAGNKAYSLRYGENPHQEAAIYSGSSQGIVGAHQHHGKEMSFNNYTDADAAWRAVLDHRDPAVAIMKHANPCGVAVCELGVAVAYQHAHECDPVSAFGGVVAANRKVDLAMAEPLSKIFTEVLIAPDFDEDALELLMKKPSIRILKCDVTTINPLELRPVSGGMLLQATDVIDAHGDSPAHWNQVSGDPVDLQTMKDLEFAWRSVRSVKSNAILLAKMTASVGIGMGQVNRVDSARLAVSRAGDRVKGSVAASDAFFPFADGLQILIDAGVTAVVQPGGSVRDEEVIAAAKAAGIAMFFTNTRHFSHA